MQYSVPTEGFIGLAYNVAVQYYWTQVKEGHSTPGEDYSEASFCFLFPSGQPAIVNLLPERGRQRRVGFRS